MSQTLAAGKPDDHFTFAIHSGQGGHAADEKTQGDDGGHLPQYAETHDQHHLRGVDTAAAGLAQRANQDDGHHNGHQNDQRGTKIARKVFA